MLSQLRWKLAGSGKERGQPQHHHHTHTSRDTHTSHHVAHLLLSALSPWYSGVECRVSTMSSAAAADGTSATAAAPNTNTGLPHSFSHTQQTDTHVQLTLMYDVHIHALLCRCHRFFHHCSLHHHSHQHTCIAAPLIQRSRGTMSDTHASPLSGNNVAGY